MMHTPTDAFAGVYEYEFSELPESAGAASGIGGSTSSSAGGTRPGSPSRLVLEGSSQSGNNGAPTDFALDLSSLLPLPLQLQHAPLAARGGGQRMDFNDLSISGMFGAKRDGDRDGGGQHHSNNHSAAHSQNQTAGMNTSAPGSQQTSNGNGSGGANPNPNTVNLEALQQLLSMQMQMSVPVQYSQHQHQQTPSSSMDGNTTMQNMGPGSAAAPSTQASVSPSAALIFEQQLRVQQLQHLQQLQNQIFQQQVRRFGTSNDEPTSRISDSILRVLWSALSLNS